MNMNWVAAICIMGFGLTGAAIIMLTPAFFDPDKQGNPWAIAVLAWVSLAFIVAAFATSKQLKQQ